MIQKNQKKIKILYLIDRLIGFAGTEKHLFQLITYFDKEAFDFDVITFGSGLVSASESGMRAFGFGQSKEERDIIVQKNRSSLMDQFANQGVYVKTLPIKRFYDLQGIKQFWNLVSLVKQFQPDIVQTFHFISDTYGVLASKFAGVKNIISSRRDMGDFKKKRHIAFNKLTNHFITRYIAVCARVGDRIEKTEKINRDKIEVIYNGLDFEAYRNKVKTSTEIRKRLGISDSAFVVGFACIFRPEKGLDTFFNAMGNLQARIENIRILAVGDGEMKKDILSLCDKLGLTSKTTFTGYVNDIREYVPAMDVVCLTSIANEGLSNAILEQMTMEKPIVATDVGGNAEIVLDGITGKIVKPGDSNELMQAVLSLYKNPELRLSMARKGMERARDEFSIERMIEKTESLYLSILNEA